MGDVDAWDARARRANAHGGPDYIGKEKHDRHDIIILIYCRTFSVFLFYYLILVAHRTFGGNNSSRVQFFNTIGGANENN